ncbi:efflux RND transporter permease subunit [Brevibacillus brevis]|uniref:efflux RND transporter permease subunit n=1 Tax=Brevibacillus brevis TaxID=1393 RepID=UPI0025A6410F|nr:efflux RND transporter permease subunit [Brevibacillus brevis]WJQ84443.1 efflux RND transporter permease subunit [Brevibacillus brevis]
MRFLTNFSLRNSTAIIIMSLLIVVSGIIAAMSLKVENMPDITFPVLLVNTTYPDASPEDVLDDVTKPLEREVGHVTGVKAVESYSSNNSSTLQVYLETGSDVQAVRDELERKISSIALPSKVNRPQVMIQGFSNQPVYYLFVTGQDKESGLDHFDNDVKETVLKELEGIESVDKVSTIGGQFKEMKILPKVDALNYYRISPLQLKQLLLDNHVALPIGSITEDGEERIIRVVSRYLNVDDIRNTKIFLPSDPTNGLTYVRLGDIAEVNFDEVVNSISRYNGKNGININIYKTRDANAVETGDAINAKLSRLKEEYPDLTFTTIYDTSVDIKNSINGMLKEGLLGAIMASVVILFFLRHVKATLIVLVSIPTSILVSLIFMSWMGITLNMITLFGMAVAVGRVVDDSIVVIENIFRHLQLNKERKENLIQIATHEMLHAITSSTFTTTAVFLPIVFVGGMIGEVFRPFALTVVCSLFASLLVAVTIVPLLAKLMILKDHNIKEYEHGKGSDAYRKLLKWSLNRKPAVGFLSLVLFVASLALLPYMKYGLFPDPEAKYIFAQVTMPKGTQLDGLDQTVAQVESKLMEQPEVEYIEINLGSENEAEIRQSNQALLLIKIGQDVNLDQTIKKFEGIVKPMIPLGSEMALTKPGSSDTNKFKVILYGPDLVRLKEASEIVKSNLKVSPLLTNVKDNLNDFKNEVVIKVDRDKASELGVSPVQVAQEVNLLVSDTRIGKIKVDDKDYSLFFGLGENHAKSLEELNNIYIQTPSKQQVRLVDFAEIDQEKVQSQIMRKDEKQFVQITADITSDNKGGASNFLFAMLQAEKLPAGVTLSSEGVSSDMEKSFKDMLLAIGAAIFIVYIVMLITFGNATAPLAILLSLPLAVIGGLFGLFISDTVLDITALIGFLMLVGIVVTNAIVYVDNIQQRRLEGTSMREAVVEAGVTRVRPIIMTAVATVSALLPLYLGFSEGALMTKSLAIVVIGGLVTSTILTLFVVPIGYELLYRIKKEFFAPDTKEAEIEPSEDMFISVLRSLRDMKKSG